MFTVTSTQSKYFDT